MTSRARPLRKPMRRVLIRISGLKSWHPAVTEAVGSPVENWGARYWLEEKDRAKLPASRYITESDAGISVLSWYVTEVRELGQRLEF